MNKNDITVADVLKYEDIKDIPFLQIYAGVGSGKNYFVEQFINGNEKYGIPKKTILIITSRRAKVDQTLAGDKESLTKNITAAWGEYHQVCNMDDDLSAIMEHVLTLQDEWGGRQVFQKSMVCTNAFIQVYQEKIYHPQDISTHLWELFDLVVVDEVHSVIMDATYQSAPFYVQQLVNEILYRQKLAKNDPETYREPKCKQVILMTGTPSSIQSLSLPKDSVTIDLRDQCRSVQPEKVQLIKKDVAIRQIEQQLASGERIIYFTNRTKTPAAFCSGTSIDPNLVSVSFSAEEKREAMLAEDSDAYQRMLAVEQSIKEHERLLPDVKLFVTTTKNKEGINLQDKDIPYMYVESHIASDIIQAAGRVRAGVKYLYIVEDAPGHGGNGWRGEEAFSHFMLDTLPEQENDVIVSFNEYLHHLCFNDNIEYLYMYRETARTVAREHESVQEYINFIQNFLPSTCYSYFHNKFEFYNFRSVGNKYVKACTTRFKRILEGKLSFTDEAHAWFPDAEIIPYDSKVTRSRDVLNVFLQTHSDLTCTEGEYLELLAVLNEIWEEDKKSANILLKRFTNWRCNRKGHDDRIKSSFQTYIFRLVNTQIG